MDLYNNYYEELYHAGLFSALRGRIRDGHKWITRTGTPGHYVYTYAKDLAGKAGSMFGKPRGLFGTRKTTSNSSRPEWGATSKSGPRSTANNARNTAEKEKREDRFVDKTSRALAKRASKPDQNGYFNKEAAPRYNSKTNTQEFESPNGRVRSAIKDVEYTNYTTPYGNKTIDRVDNATIREGSSNARVYRRAQIEPKKKKSAADQVKEWANNTFGSIRKTANNAADSVKDWVSNTLGKKNERTGAKKTSNVSSGTANTPKPVAGLAGKTTSVSQYSRPSTAISSSKPSTQSGKNKQTTSTSSSSAGVSSSSQNRPRARQKNITNSKNTAVSVNKSRKPYTSNAKQGWSTKPSVQDNTGWMYGADWTSYRRKSRKSKSGRS